MKSDFERILIPEALSVIKCLSKDFEEGLAMKKIYESKISLHEVFLEAVPTSFIYTFLFVRAYVGENLKWKFSLQNYLLCLLQDTQMMQV